MIRLRASQIRRPNPDKKAWVFLWLGLPTLRCAIPWTGKSVGTGISWPSADRPQERVTGTASNSCLGECGENTAQALVALMGAGSGLTHVEMRQLGSGSTESRREADAVPSQGVPFA
ncbi:hypothetical protein ACWCRC_28430 [Streptomyces sp. NPDC001940]